MSTSSISKRISNLLEVLNPLYQFMTASSYAQRGHEPGICDFVVGNPHEMPLPDFVAALQRWSVPQNKDWFAYTDNDPQARAVVANSLRERRGVPFEPDDIFLTNGSFAAQAVTLHALIDSGDEVIFLSPPWFFYESLIMSSGAVPVRVKLQPPGFDLDVKAIEAAITDRTRAIIVNTPNNPTGRIYSPSMLESLAEVLTRASERLGRTIYLLSDEAYSRIVYDGREFCSPTEFYPHGLVLYTYGKTLLTPGQRMGYIALPPTMPEREQLRPALFLAQMMLGYAFPNALLQHALPDLEPLTIDVAHLQRKRDRMVKILRDIGYEVNVPEGTFYLLVRSPLEDDVAFIERLAEQNIFCLPGRVFELPGYFRISLTANDDMIERAAKGFAAVLKA
ncbi:MAG TPA: aminotransferase class I/II-fold pyridoxal phosphate-dependent enzyme [Anaerolineae bacterium]|nr:aminotransferase class I/II-fold pyridoxal phosphate-dependent enzyme [Anaerolineae bacterium]